MRDHNTDWRGCRGDQRWSTLQVEAMVVVDGLGKGRGMRDDSYIFGLGDVGAGYRLGRNEEFLV